MSEDWRGDVNTLLDLVDQDKQLLEKIGAKLHQEEREILKALVASHGDPKALVEQLGPIAIAKLKARGLSIPQRLRQPVSTIWEHARAPLMVLWNGPSKPTPDALAQAFLDRYGKRLEELTNDAEAAGASILALAECLRTATATKELATLAGTLQAQVQQLSAAAQSCTHADSDRAGWAKESGDLAKESLQTLQLIRSLDERLTKMNAQLHELSDAVREWVVRTPEERATHAQSMSTRMLAARDAIASMREEFTGLVLGH